MKTKSCLRCKETPTLKSDAWSRSYPNGSSSELEVFYLKCSCNNRTIPESKKTLPTIIREWNRYARKL